MRHPNHEGDAHALQRIALSLLAYMEAEGVPEWLPRQPVAPRHWKRRAGITAAVSLAFIALMWAGGNMFGTRYDLQGTHFAARTPDSTLTQAIRDKAQSYRLRIIQPDGSKQAFSLQDIGIRAHADSTIAIARQQQTALSHRLQWWKPIPLKLVTSTDTKRLQAFIELRATVTTQAARDAALSFNNGAALITDGAPGKQYGLDNPAHTIMQAVSSLQTAPLRLHPTTRPPSITAKALADTKARLENTLKQPIVFMVGNTPVHPGTAEVAGWIALTPDPAAKTTTLNVKPDAVQAYVNALADDHSHPPRTQVSLGAGSSIPGSYGVTITGIDEAVAIVTQHLLDAKGLQVALPARQTPFKTITASASSKWIEVDLTTKRLYAYERTTLARTFLISAGRAGTPTVTGTFAIYSKFARQTMSGANADGSNYVQPNVPWINYFYRDYAIHGNYWRPTSYFGNVHSSHGCVGLTPGDAAWVYSWAPIGTPVVVHT